MDATCAWARADTTWWVGLAEVDATCAWARADTTWGGGQGSQKWMQHGHVLAQLGGGQGSQKWMQHGHVLAQLGGQGSQKWMQHGHVLTQLGRGAGLLEVDATGDAVLAQGSPVTHISIMFWNLHKSLDQCQAYCIPDICKVHSIKKLQYTMFINLINHTRAFFFR